MTPARRVLPIFFLILTAIFFVVPIGVGLWDFGQYLGDPSGRTTISYLLTHLIYANPFVGVMLGDAVGMYHGLVVGLFIHLCAGMTRPAVEAELDDLRLKAADRARGLDAKDAEIERLTKQLEQFIGKGG